MELIFDIIENYGLVGVIFIIISFFAYIYTKYIIYKIDNTQDSTSKSIDNLANSIVTNINKENKELISTITKQNDLLIKNISEQEKIIIDQLNSQNNNLINIITSSNEKTKDDYHSKLFQRINSTEKINIKLSEIGYKYHADRVAILEFHNSSQNLVGIPFAKYSCNFEWINKGSISLQAKCQSLPFSIISNVVKEIIDSGNTYIIYDDINTIKDYNSGLHILLKEANAKSIIYVGLYNNDNQIISLLVLEYHQNVNDLNVDINKLLIDGESISTLINLS